MRIASALAAIVLIAGANAYAQSEPAENRDEQKPLIVVEAAEEAAPVNTGKPDVAEAAQASSEVTSETKPQVTAPDSGEVQGAEATKGQGGAQREHL